MIHLFDKETGEALGTITQEQLDFLIEHLEEESLGDQDYYLRRDTLDTFAQAGADPELLTLLKEAFGRRQEMEIRWAKT